MPGRLTGASLPFAVGPLTTAVARPPLAVALLPLAVALAGWLSACDAPQFPRDLATLQDSTATVDILESSAMCSDCITVDRVVALGDTAGPGYINWSIYVAVDDAGNYWVGQQQEGVIKVWDAEGRFLRQVGRRGDGPMEFHRPAPVRTDGEGRVHIVDLDIGRETIVNADFSYHSDRLLDPGGSHLAVPLGDDGRYLLNRARMTTQRVAMPLHIVNGPNVLHSFGRMAGLDAPGNAHRVLAVDRQPRIYSTRAGDYLIQVWSESGRRILGLRGPRLNEKEARPERWSPDNPPRSEIYAMQVDSEQRLWVIGLALRDDWQDHMELRRMPNGQIAYGPTDGDIRTIFQGRIDVIDLTRGSFIATRRHDALLEAFVGDGLAIENTETETGYPQMVVWRLGFDAAG
ncbi:MAG: hypothetical protein OXI50_10285 [Gammaproteobacteria bacterium]|nr:hypothetical protein [Gammaproteobacteria bacterium]